MAYRNGTYVAFNGCGTTYPIESDIKYYNLLKAWNKNKNIDFSFSNSHDKTSQVKDTSKLATLKARLEERMKSSKNMLLLITKNSLDSKSLLNWEIELAVEKYSLPIIVSYVFCNEYFTDIYAYRDFWPPMLLKLCRDNNPSIRALHIPFRKDVLMYAIDTYSFIRLPSSSVSIICNDFYHKKFIDN